MRTPAVAHELERVARQNRDRMPSTTRLAGISSVTALRALGYLGLG